MLTGVWVGTLDVGSARLRMKLTFDDDRGATLYSLNQGGQPIPGTVSTERIQLEFPSVRGQFVGREIGLERIEGFGCRTARIIRFCCRRSTQIPDRRRRSRSRANALRNCG